MQRVLKHHNKITEVINLEIIKKVEEVRTIKAVNETLKASLA